MKAQDILDRLCARYGVEPDQGARLLPLIRWALKGPDGSRDRILAVVERSLSGVESSDQQRKQELDAAADHAVLVAVGRILHNWKPTDSILGLDFGIAATPEERDGEQES